MQMNKASSTSRDKREQRKQNELAMKRQYILETAEKIFAQRGFHKTKMEDIADECGHAVGALYKYFESKDEIYRELIQTKLDRLHALLVDATSSSSGIDSTVRDVVRKSVDYFEKNQDFFRIYVNEVKGFQWNLETRVANSAFARYQGFLEILEKVFESSVRAGEIRADIQPKSLAITLVGIINSFFTQWVTRPERSSWRLDAAEIETIILDGIRIKKK